MSIRNDEQTRRHLTKQTECDTGNEARCPICPEASLNRAGDGVQRLNIVDSMIGLFVLFGVNEYGAAN